MIKVRYTVAALSLAAALAINLAALAIRTNAQSSSNRAGLVVQYGDGQVVTRCVTFTEPQITGYDLLKRSRLSLVVDVQSGGTVCKIGNSGCNFPAQQCFCDCQELNQSCVYWIYYTQSGGAWKYASLGMNGQAVINGSVNGWIYGAGNASSSSTLPPFFTIDQICGAASQALPVTTSISTPAAQGTMTPAQSTPTETRITPTGTPMPQALVVKPAPATPDSPTVVPTASEPTMTITPRSTSTVLPTTTPLPQATARQAVEADATAIIAPTVTANGQPGNDTARPSSISGYLLFGAIAGGLLVLLLVTRRSAGNRKL